MRGDGWWQWRGERGRKRGETGNRSLRLASPLPYPYLSNPPSTALPSGAIFGLGAALGLFYWRHKEALGRTSESMLQQLGVTVAINVVYSLVVKNIDNWWAEGEGEGE